MNEYWNVSIPEVPDGVSESNFLKLKKNFKENFEDNELRFERISPHEFSQLVSVCKKYGLVLPPSGNRFESDISISQHFEYSADELAKSHFVQLVRAKRIASSKSIVDGTLVKDEFFSQNRDFVVGGIGYNRIGVRQSIKNDIESQCFLGLTFSECNVNGGWDSDIEKIWELSSSIVLPKIKNSAITDEGKIIPSGSDPAGDNGFYLLDGYSVGGRIFLAEEGLPEFDFAFTTERFGPRAQFARPFRVCSNRFYNYFNSLAGEINWRMVLEGNHEPVAVVNP